VYSEKLSRAEFLRKVLGLGGVVATALVFAACAPGEDEEEDDD
jgi:hypothetical protein